MTSSVTGDGHQGIGHSGIGIPAISSREPEAGSRNPNGRNLEGWLPWLSPVTRGMKAYRLHKGSNRFREFSALAQPLPANR